MAFQVVADDLDQKFVVDMPEACPRCRAKFSKLLGPKIMYLGDEKTVEIGCRAPRCDWHASFACYCTSCCDVRA